jgi:hypothetical protein
MALTYAGHYELKPVASPAHNPSGGEWFDGSGNHAPYVGDNNERGETASHATFAKCSGAIVTIYRWVKDKIPGTQTDDPNDLPPEYVVAVEYAKATYSILYAPTISITETNCDNGLDFTSSQTSTPGLLLRSLDLYDSNRNLRRNSIQKK